MSAASSDLVQSALRGELALFGCTSAGARLLELPGVLACVVPATPQRSLFNAVVYEQGQDLLSAWQVLDQTYLAAGVRAWTVWLQPGDAATSGELMRRGHRLDGSPIGMAAAIDALSLAPAGDLDWTTGCELDSVGALNDASYTFDTPAFRAALGATRSTGFRSYVARLAGKPTCGLCVHDEPDGTLGVSAVATLPEARGRGLASRLLSVALREAKERGLTHTALVASSDGRGVYARLGYRETAARELWENRK